VPGRGKKGKLVIHYADFDVLDGVLDACAPSLEGTPRMSASIASGNPQLSVVVPVHNEEDNVAPLVGEIVAALRGVISFEIVYVDDTSRDATLQRLRDLQATTPELRVIRHLSNAGQSTAVRNGVKAARAPWIATLDGDGQNDPADIPKLLANAMPRPPTSSCSPAGG
jgi:cellulose synthase/poly-beta-1,6-N-acetylglucosamine synthase-like glycosyltransferase